MLPHLSEMPQWRIQGRGPGGPPPLKIFLGTGPPSYLRGWKTGPTPPPYLKVWIRNCAPPPCKQALTFERQHMRETICKAARNEGGSPREEKIVVFSLTARGSWERRTTSRGFFLAKADEFIVKIYEKIPQNKCCFLNIGKVLFLALMRYQSVEHNKEHFKKDCFVFFNIDFFFYCTSTSNKPTTTTSFNATVFGRRKHTRMNFPLSFLT